MQIYKFELVEKSKKMAWEQNQSVLGSIDMSFTMQVKNDIIAAANMPIIIP